ncbi:MAG: heavy metal-associated domain-containing protein [Patescibacteria group bacterium]
MKTTLSIPGMHCASCLLLVKDVSSEFTEIQNVHVDLETKKVFLEHMDDFDLQNWISEIEALGEAYKVQD